MNLFGPAHFPFNFALPFDLLAEQLLILVGLEEHSTLLRNGGFRLLGARRRVELFHQLSNASRERLGIRLHLRNSVAQIARLAQAGGDLANAIQICLDIARIRDNCGNAEDGRTYL